MIHADVGMIEQIVLNLAVNARDAMPNGGNLSVRTATDKLADKDTGAEEIRVQLQIADNGAGIAPEILPRIFEPFFTTKEVGKGTGLGLATVYGIVQQHGGTIEVQSELGQRTTFTLSFPVASAVSDTEYTQVGGATKPSLPWGTETILLVEDEQPLRVFISELLQRCGYTVFEAASGPEALKIWEQQRDQIDLLFTDIIMPQNMSGIELGQKILTENPALKIIYSSGYTGNVEGRRSTLKEGENLIRKPYKPDALAALIRKQLDARPASKKS